MLSTVASRHKFGDSRRGTTVSSGFKKFLVGTAVAALVGGGLVVSGLDAQYAQAAPPAPPEVTTSTPSSYIWGEDLPIGITFTGVDGPQYNASAGVVIPEGATIVSTGDLGTPIVYAAGTTLPSAIATGSAPDTCAALGLSNPPSGSPAGSCAVPAGAQYLVFQNIHDLPAGGSASHTLTVRPNAAQGSFDLGKEFPYQVNGYTNSDPRYIPVFPGSTGVNSTDAIAGTSNTEPAGESVLINGMRITKTQEVHPENEVLRGVHGDRGTIYELKIEHTGQANLDNAVVVDYLPAGLEYLGSCGLEDSTTNANGTQGVKEEYPNAGPLNTAPVGDNCRAEASIETVQGAFNEAGEFVAGAGAVYTKVTWNVGTWLMDNPKGVEQAYPDAAGNPAETIIRYRAGVPLFENTMDFGDVTPSAESLKQGANLDNNRGASTRHGTEDLSVRGEDGDEADANSYTNHAFASGSFNDQTVSDNTSETIDAVDVRIVKSVELDTTNAGSSFEQGKIARYNLALATSEYISATHPDPTTRPLRIVDDMSDGLCPIFGPGTKFLGEGNAPQLFIGGYNPYEPGTKAVSIDEWNTALEGAGVDTACHWGSGYSVGSAEKDAMTGGKLSAIAFSAKTGRFFLELAMDPAEALAAPDKTHNIGYSVHQNTAYIKGTDAANSGATTSQDRFANTAEINLRTTPIERVLGVGTPGISDEEQSRIDSPWNSWDDSEAAVQAGPTELSKMVLERGALPSRDSVSKSEAQGGPAENRWVKAAEQPFAPGDKTWYRIIIDPPNGADVRNPVFTDFLPEGVHFDGTKDSSGSFINMKVVPTGAEQGNLPSLGTCTPSSAAEWVNRFASSENIKVDENVLTFELGERGEVCGIGGTDRFLPFEASLEIYLLVTVTEPSAFAKVDLPQNLAKYQQENVDREIFFLRDEAVIERDRAPRLLKGIKEIKPNAGAVETGRDAESQLKTDGTVFNSNRDSIEVVQGELVTYRLDVTAPYTDTEGYLIWDVLPKGIKVEDFHAGSMTAKLVTGGVEETGSVDFSAELFDYPYTGAPDEVSAQLKDEFKDDHRSVLVWDIESTVPASTKEQERGISLSYTVKIPGGAQVSQSYANDASIVEYGAVNNDGSDSTSTIIVDGTDNVANPRVPTAGNPGIVFEDKNNDTSDPSVVFLPSGEFKKELISTELENETNNNQTQITQGEYATYQYSVTVPAHTSVQDGKLADRGYFTRGTTPIPYEYVTGSTKFFIDGAEATCDSGGKLAGPNSQEFFCAESENAPTSGRPSGEQYKNLYGVLTFPETYTNSTDTDQVFTAEITVWVKDRDATELNDLSNYSPELAQSNDLKNIAYFAYNDPNTGNPRVVESEATVQYVEPEPNIAKNVTAPTDGVAKPGDEATYSLTVTNPANRPALFDGVVYDCVPEFLTPDAASFVAENGAAEIVPGAYCELDANSNIVMASPNKGVPANQGNGTLIKWTLTDPILSANPATLTYTAEVSEDVGGGLKLTNGAYVVGYTLPKDISNDDTTERRGDRANDDNKTVEVLGATLDKKVRVSSTGEFLDSTSAPVGETVEYKIVTTLPADANFYDVTLIDSMPAGLEYVAGQPLNIEFVGWNDNPSVTGPEVSGLVEGGQTLSWAINPDDLISSDQARTIAITFKAKITDKIDLNRLDNTAKFEWNSKNNDGDSRETVEDDARVTIINPDPKITKQVNGKDSDLLDPSETFTYTVNVTNQGDTDAYNLTIVDKIPNHIIVTPGTISEVQGVEGVLTGNTAIGGGTITWANVPGPLKVWTDGVDPSETIALKYDATFDESANLKDEDFAYTNIVNVTKYESFDKGGWEYRPPTMNDDGTYNDDAGNNPDGSKVPVVNADADVTPVFPYVELKKEVAAGEEAFVGTPFGWKLNLVNTGHGDAKEVSIIDSLPKNWVYTTGSAKIKVGAGSEFALEPSLGAVIDGVQTLTWSAAELRDKAEIDASGVMLPGTIHSPAADALARSITVYFEATPQPLALKDAGTGLTVPHTNTLKATVKTTTGFEGDSDRPLVDPEDKANAYIAEADLLLEKDAIGGVIEQTDPADNIYGLSEGTWIAGQTPEPGRYDQPQWQITVTNHGPDASEGPFVFKDTTTLPEGVTTGAWSAYYYPTAADAAAGTNGTQLNLEVTTDGFNVSGTDLSLKADGSDRIVAKADVNVRADAPVTNTLAHNIASVEGKTYEDPANIPDEPGVDNPNEDEAEKPFVTVADLAIEKNFATVTGDRKAGDPIAWSMKVTNNGPSDSVSSSTKPITVTDTVPGEIENISQLDGSVLPGGWALALDGNSITLTLTPDAIFPNGKTVEFSFTGKIKSSVLAGTEILNTGVVNPGETPDPEPGNNEDTTTTEPTTSETTVVAKKYRVELVDGTWVKVADDAAKSVPGDTIHYMLEATNTGQADTDGIVFIDELPAELIYENYEAVAPGLGWDASVSGQKITISNDVNLAPGASAAIVLATKIVGTVAADIVNTVCVDTGNEVEDPLNPNGDCATDTTGSSKLVDWQLEKSHTVPAAGAVNAGEIVRYELLVSNNGPSDSEGPITVTDVLPTGFTYIGNAEVTGQGTLTATEFDQTGEGLDRITWKIDGPFTTGKNLITIAFDALVADSVDPGNYVNKARVDNTAPEEPESNPDNNEDTDEIPVVRTATMTIDKKVEDGAGGWVESAQHIAGTEVNWLVTITNEGPSVASVNFVDDLTAAPGVTLLDLNGEGWDCDVEKASCDYVANEGMHPVGVDNATTILVSTLIAADVPPTADPGLINWGKISWVDNTTQDPTAEDDAAITVIRGADLGIVKLALDSEGEETTEAVAGESLWYSLQVTNHGASDAVAPIIVNDELPAGIKFVALTGESAKHWTANVDPSNEQLVTFTRTEADGILVGQDAPAIHFEVSVDPSVTAVNESGESNVLTNVASIDDETLDTNGDTNEDNNSDTADVEPKTLADLAITKTASTEKVVAGANIDYTLVVENVGPSDANAEITVVDQLPAGMTYAAGSAQISVGAADAIQVDPIVEENAAGDKLTWNMLGNGTTLKVGDTITITLTVATAADQINPEGATNIATVDSPEDTDPTNNEDEATVVIDPLVTIITTKTAIGEFVVGSTGQYQITVENLGPTEAPGPLTVTDVLPKGLDFASSPDANHKADGKTVTWTLEDGLKVGEKATLTLFVKISQGAYPSVTNVVNVEVPPTTTITPESKLTDDVVTPVAADPLANSGAQAPVMLATLGTLMLLGGGALVLARRRSATRIES